MLRTMFTSKIHRATVTQADLHYVGSCTVDEELLDAAKLLPGQQVTIVNVNNGARFETYLIPGERGTGVIGLNGAAARLGAVGDLVIIMAYGLMDCDEAASFTPSVVHVDTANRIVQVGADPAEGMIEGVQRPTGSITPPQWTLGDASEEANAEDSATS